MNDMALRYNRSLEALELLIAGVQRPGDSCVHGAHVGHVTERSGSPQTLVCRKTRKSYRRRCGQHAEDVAMRALQALGAGPLDPECARLAAAVVREPQLVEG